MSRPVRVAMPRRLSASSVALILAVLCGLRNGTIVGSAQTAGSGGAPLVGSSAGPLADSCGVPAAVEGGRGQSRQDAFDNLDAATLGADYSDDCIVDSPAGGTHTGRVAAEKVLRTVFDAFLDLKVRTDRLIVDGNHVAQVMSVEGTDLGGFLGLPPTGKIFQLPAVFLYELNGAQIVRERRIYDFTGMLVQIGVLKAKPT